jgi:hypothetical protein
MPIKMRIRDQVVIGSLFYFYKFVGVVGLWLAKLLIRCPDEVVCCSKNVGTVTVVNIQLAKRNDKISLLLDYTNRATLILKHIWDDDIKGGGFNVTKLMDYVEPFHVLYLDYLNQTGQLIKSTITVKENTASVNGLPLSFNNFSFSS